MLRRHRKVSCLCLCYDLISTYLSSPSGVRSRVRLLFFLLNFQRVAEAAYSLRAATFRGIATGRPQAEAHVKVGENTPMNIVRN
jgi:hypothetical protein